MNTGRLKLNLPRFDSRVLQISVVIVPLLVAAGFLCLSDVFRGKQARALESVRATHLVRESLDRTLIFLDEAQAGERGLVFTGSFRSAFTFFFQKTNLTMELLVLRQLLVQTHAEQSTVHQATRIIEARIAELNRVVGLALSGNLAQARTATVADLESGASQEFHGAIASLGRSVDRQVSDQHQDLLTRITALDRLSSGLLAVSVLVLIGAGLLLLRLRQLQSLITICAWTQRVNYKGKWMRMEEFLWKRFRVKVSHGISEEAFDGVMGVVGKNLTVSDSPRTPDS